MKKEVASFQRRAIAYIIDLLIINFLILSPFNIFKKSIELAFSRELIIITISAAILTLLYFTLLELTTRQTIGKMITMIYVGSTKKTLDLRQCLIRNISKTINIILIFDVIYALVRKTHQRYSEIVANTEVLKVRIK